MPFNKMVSGTSNVECIPFPIFSTNRELLRDKSCYMIKPYDDGKLVSVFTLKEKDGNILKILSKDGTHLSPNEAEPIEKEIIIALNIGLTLGVKQSQLFFSVKNKEAMLVDVFDGKTFISPGMISDIYGKRMKTQEFSSIEVYDPGKTYNAIIKPKIVCYENNSPVYVKG